MPTQMSLMFTPVLLRSMPLTPACRIRALTPRHSFEFSGKACGDTKLYSISETCAHRDLPHFPNIQALTLKVSQGLPALGKTFAVMGRLHRNASKEHCVSVGPFRSARRLKYFPVLRRVLVRQCGGARHSDAALFYSPAQLHN